MHDALQARLESLGLSAGEALVYLTLLRSGGTLGATALASATKLPRTRVYPLLNALTEKGIVEAEAGYGSRFTAVRPTRALPLLIARERDEQREKLLQREQLAGDLVEELEAIAEPVTEAGEAAELIQILRDPRVITERYERLQMEAERDIQGFVKAPIFIAARPDNPVQKQVRRRGVRVRVIYERAVIDDPLIKPHLAGWIGGGEEARVFEGELPHKLQIFDQEVVLLPLIVPGDRTRTLFIRHKQLATSLSMLFEVMWERSQRLELDAVAQAPSEIKSSERGRTKTKRPSRRSMNQNGKSGR